MPSKSDDRSITLRAFSVLDAVLDSNRGLTLADLIAAVKLPKPTAYRILGLLEDAALLARDLDGRHYVPGPALARMAYATFASNSYRGPRQALLRSLADQTGESCGLAVLDSAEARTVEAADSRWPLRLDLPVGTRLPLHSTASGKLLLAHHPAALREPLLARLTLARFTPRTLVDRNGLVGTLASIRRDGFALDDEEWLAGLVCLAVPVTAKNGRTLAALTIQAPVARLTASALQAHLPDLRRTATLIAETLSIA